MFPYSFTKSGSAFFPVFSKFNFLHLLGNKEIIVTSYTVFLDITHNHDSKNSVKNELNEYSDSHKI